MRSVPTDPGRFYIINAPYIFTTVWSVVKGWLDPVTTEKIQILGSSPVSELGKQIPLENLPSIIGGHCNCPGGCQLSDAGPWNTPEGEEIIQRVKEQKEKAKVAYERGEDPSPEAPNTAPDAGAAGVKDSADAKDSGAVAAAGAGGAAAAGAGGAAAAAHSGKDDAAGKAADKVATAPTDAPSSDAQKEALIVVPGPEDEAVIPVSGTQSSLKARASTELAPPLTDTAELANPVDNGEELQLTGPLNGELAPAITKS